MSKTFKGIALLLASSLCISALPACQSVHTHEYHVYNTIAATCTEDGTNYYKCDGCGDTYEESISALGHNYAESSSGYSYLLPCTREGCYSGIMPENLHTYDEQLAYSFSSSDDEQITKLYSDIISCITASADLEGGEAIYAGYLNFADLYSQYEGKVDYVYAQQQNAEVKYFVNYQDGKAQENYEYITAYYADIQQKYYEVYSLIAESKFNDFFFTGWTDSKKQQFLKYYQSYSQETAELTKLNNELLMSYYAIEDPATSPIIPDLYAKIVDTNTKLAKNYGYDDYLEYARKEIYYNDYSSDDIAQMANYAKQYLVPLYTELAAKYQDIRAKVDLDELTTIITGNFFENVRVNKYVNDYFKALGIRGSLNFTDIFTSAFKNGTVFTTQLNRSSSNLANAINSDVLVFGVYNQNGGNIASMFGNYTFDVYNYDLLYKQKAYTQSYDLSTAQNYGFEALYIYYLQNEISADLYTATRYYYLSNYVENLLSCMAYQTFEQAIYSDSYSGLGAEDIMKDGTITTDEYDKLYEYIVQDWGLSEDYNDYWRYCIYVSGYFTSLSTGFVSTLQLFAKAESDGFNATAECLSKLITYLDEQDGTTYTYTDVLKYAGLYSYDDEELYKQLVTALV